MRHLTLAAVVIVASACGPQKPAAPPKAVHVASARDTAFIRASCFMPDSVLAGKAPCIDRVQKTNVRVF